MSIDYADENMTITNDYIDTCDVKCNDTSKVLFINESNSSFIAKSNDTIHTIAPKYPTISMYAKPSCGCRYSYTWHYRTFIDYCPNCYHYNTLRKNPKGVAEREYTCSRCSSDFCGVCGKEKMGYSKVYLRGA